MSLVDFTQFVNDLATVSGQAILPFFRSSLVAMDKSLAGAFDPVTEADKAGEAAMRQLIKRTFPSHGIVGEEYGSEHPDADYVWVLDPIDGTRAFIAGLPVWGTLIGLTRKGTPCFGMMHQPFTGERFYGDGGSAFFQRTGEPASERKLRTRPCPSLRDAVISTTSPRLFVGEELRAYDRVESVAKLARYGCDCYAYCMLAAGHIDVVIEAGLKAYDIVALIPIIEGAGGVVTAWDGGPASEGGSVVAIGDRRLQGAVLELLNG